MVCIGEIIFPIALSAFFHPVAMCKISISCQLLHMAGMQNRALGLALKLRGCIAVSLAGRWVQMCWLYLFSALGFAQFGLVTSVFVCTCTIYMWERFTTSSLQTKESKGSDCPLPLMFNLATPKEWFGDLFFSFFLTCMCFVPKIWIERSLTAERWYLNEISTASTVLCLHGLTLLGGGQRPGCVSVGCRGVSCTFSCTAQFFTAFQPWPDSLSRTRIWEPFVSWYLKPFAHIIAQTRVC